MKRIFGTSKPAPQGPSLDEAVQKMDSRVASLDEKIRKLDAELNVYKEKMKKTREGTAAHTQLKQRALKLLKQRKMYEGQREQLMGQQLNMEQANFASQTLKDTVTTVGAMKTANTSLKQQFKTVNIDDIDNLQDEMADLLDMNNEIQDSLARSYDVGQFDESELEGELEALGEELDLGATPSYLSSLPSTEPTEQMSKPTMTQPLSN